MSDLGIYVMFIFGVMLAFEALETYKSVQNQKYDIEEKKLASVKPSDAGIDLKMQIQAMNASLPKIQRPAIVRFDGVRVVGQPIDGFIDHIQLRSRF